MKQFKFLSGLLATTLVFAVSAFSPKAEEIKNEAQDTELVLVVDKSGSMYHLANDTIGSFNSVIEEQKDPSKSGNVFVTSVMFNDSSVKVHDRVNVKDVEPITRNEYSPSGCTALYDAVGSTITELSNSENAKNNKVVFVIITDGYENSSREYDKPKVKKLIEEMTAKGWQFIFLGANIDSASEAQKIGISAHHSRTFEASSDGLKYACAAVGCAVNQVREGSKVDLDKVDNAAQDREDSAKTDSTSSTKKRKHRKARKNSNMKRVSLRQIKIA